MITPGQGEKIFFDSRFKIGRHGFVFRMDCCGDWIKSCMTRQEFENTMCDYVFDQEKQANREALAAIKQEKKK